MITIGKAAGFGALICALTLAPNVSAFSQAKQRLTTEPREEQYSFDQQIDALKVQNAEVAQSLQQTIDLLNKTSELTPEIRRADYTAVRKQIVELGALFQPDAPLPLAMDKYEAWVRAQMSRLNATKGGPDAFPDIEKFIGAYQTHLNSLTDCRTKLASLQRELDGKRTQLYAAERRVTELLLLSDSATAIAQLKDSIQQLTSLISKTDDFIRDVSGVASQARVMGSSTKG